MSRNYEMEIALLELHASNIRSAETLEEYKAHHAAYVDNIVVRLKIEKELNEANLKYVYRVTTDPEAMLARAGKLIWSLLNIYWEDGDGREPAGVVKDAIDFVGYKYGEKQPE